MRRFAAIVWAIAAASALAAAPACAAEEGPKARESVALEAVALPVIVDGRLLNYVFVSIKLEVNPKADGAVVRAKEQFFRDDLVRVGHRTPFTVPNDYTRIDEARVKSELLRFAATLVGPGVVEAVTITKQVSQKLMTLQRQTGPHGPDLIP